MNTASDNWRDEKRGDRPIIDFLASSLAFALERRDPRQHEDYWLLADIWIQRFTYRQVFSVVLFKTLKRAIDGRAFSWDKIERTAAWQGKTGDRKM